MGINVLSLFDGMSCGRVALERAGFEVDNYYASEIDKWAMKVSGNNFPAIKQLGDVTNWFMWDEFDWSSIDIIFAGFPCQAWSVAGKQGGDTDPRGALVHDLLDIWREVEKHNPNVKFLFENVKMKKDFLEYINKEIFKVEPVLINSALVSAQNRQRYYWTNINNGVIEQPEDRGVLLGDVLEEGAVDREKSYCIDASYWKGGDLKSYFDKSRRQLVFRDKAQTLLACMYKENPKSMVKRNKWGYLSTNIDATHARKLTPIECERLQTLPDNYTEGVSNTQRYKMIGNGWNVDTIVHILKHWKR